tara:strand:- start:487 stop:636 length:150 start_codon:yes stop_codon:yes gene_type:complete
MTIQILKTIKPKAKLQQKEDEKVELYQGFAQHLYVVERSAREREEDSIN